MGNKIGDSLAKKVYFFRRKLVQRAKSLNKGF
jgi:hypothetical protein